MGIFVLVAVVGVGCYLYYAGYSEGYQVGKHERKEG